MDTPEGGMEAMPEAGVPDASLWQRKRWHQRLGFGFLGLLTLLALVPVGVLFGFLIQRGATALSWEFLTAAPRDFLTAGGIMPAIVGTLLLTLLSMFLAFPLGVGTAIYLVEYSHDSRFTRLVRLAIINLAGVPSVVYGLFGLGLFVLALGLGRSLAAGALTLGFLSLPVMIAAAEESLRAVPRRIRQGSMALGATRWQTIARVVLPAALPSMITGTIISIGRAAGETAPIMFTAAVFYTRGLPSSLSDQVMALPYHVYVIVSEVPGVPRDMAYGAALVLVLMVGVLNGAAAVYRMRLRRRRQV